MTVSIFALLTVFIQACLVQNVYCQCGMNSGNFGSAIGQGIGLGSSVPQIFGPIGLNSEPEIILQGSEGYGGTGFGEVFANGILPVEGYTTISGQVPIMGVVIFDGPVQAKGSVSISGSCGCGCQL